MTDLLIVGGCARAAAGSARRAGLTFRTIDLFGDADLCRAADLALRADDYPDGLIELALQQRPGPWMFTGGLENYDVHVDRLAAWGPLCGNPGSVLRAIRDPWQLAESLRSEPIEAPALADPRSPSAEGSWLLKPRRSSGGTHIRPWSPGERLPADVQEWYLQQTIAGDSFGALYLGDGRSAVWLGWTSQRLTNPPRRPFASRFAGSIGPLPATAEQRTQLERLGNILAARFALRGLFGADLVSDAAGKLWLVEVNPRYTASVEVLEQATGWPLLVWHLDVFRGAGLPAIEVSEVATWFAKAIVYSPRRFTVSDELSQRWLARSGPFERPELADIPHAGTQLRRGQPVLTVFASGATRAAVEHQLAKQEKAIRQEVVAASSSQS